MTNNEFNRKSQRFNLSKKSRKHMNNYFEEYCDNTSIHGFKYLGERKRSCLEKFWWFITISFAFAMCAYQILLAYNKWERSPVIVSFATKQVPIFEIPFPAVTICPEVKSDKNKFDYAGIYNKLKANRNLKQKEKKGFEYMSLICEPTEMLLSNVSRIVKHRVLNFFYDVMPNINETGVSCEWLGEKKNCSELFNTIITDEGVCYTFNMLDKSEIFTNSVKPSKNFFNANKSDGYTAEGYDTNNETLTSYPRRALYPGAKSGLIVKLRSLKKDLDFVCGNSLQGYKILLHHPSEIPRVSQQYFRLPLDQAVVAALTPEMMTTTKELVYVEANKRQCYFPHERKLKFFEIYTQRTCEIECLTNYTLQQCKCIDFHMPGEDETEICGPQSIKCMKLSESILLQKEIMEWMQLRETDKNSSGLKYTLAEMFQTNRSKTTANKNSCNCLPACSSITYNAETSQSKWYWQEIEKARKNASRKNDTQVEYRSMLVVYFKDTQFIPSERDELTGQTDFLASCGGLLGLFIGCSFVSVVEVIYFFTLRLCCNIRLYGRKFWYGGKPSK